MRSDSKLDFKTSVRQLNTKNPPAFESHLSSEDLAAYHRGKIPERADEIQQHLVLCQDCRQLLLDLARFLDDAGDAEDMSPAEFLEAWQDLKKSLMVA